MSIGGQLTQQLQQDLQNELTTANQLLRLISIELQKIKTLTRPGGEFEQNIKQNASLISNVAHMQQISLENIPQMKRIPLTNMDITNNTNQNMSYEQHDSFRNSMEESQ